MTNNNGTAVGSQRWCPIADAPRDGTQIIISGGDCYENCGYEGDHYCFDGEVGIASWNVSYKQWHGEETRDGYMIHNPTHWIPLPEAPDLEEA